MNTLRLSRDEIFFVASGLMKICEPSTTNNFAGLRETFSYLPCLR